MERRWYQLGGLVVQYSFTSIFLSYLYLYPLAYLSIILWSAITSQTKQHDKPVLPTFLFELFSLFQADNCVHSRGCGSGCRLLGSDLAKNRFRSTKIPNSTLKEWIRIHRFFCEISLVWFNSQQEMLSEMTLVQSMVIRVDGCSESPALRRSHVDFSTIVLPDFVQHNPS